MPDFKVSITRCEESLPRAYEAITLSEYHYQGIHTEHKKDLESPNFLLTAAGKSIEGAAAHPTQYPVQARCCYCTSTLTASYKASSNLLL